MANRKARASAPQRGKRGKTGPPGSPGVAPDVLQRLLDDVVDLRRIAEIQFERLAQIQAQLDLLVASVAKKRQQRASKATQMWIRAEPPSE